MIRNETRESAHLRSRVKDLSQVPNIISYVPLLAAITPVSKLELNEAGLYDPILVRDTDSLIANFGDPRIDPEKYIDLYSIMQVVGNGTSCYVAKVPTGTAGEYIYAPASDSIIDPSESGTIDYTQSGNKYIFKTKNKYTVTAVTAASNASSGFIDSEVGGMPSGSSGVILPISNASDSTSLYEDITVSSSNKSYSFTQSTKKISDETYNFETTVTLDIADDDAPANISIITILDQDFGAEKITLSTTDNKLFTSNTLDREYVILDAHKVDVSDANDPVIGDSVSIDYSQCEWSYSDSKYTLKISFDSTLLGENEELWITSAVRKQHCMNIFSSMTSELTFECALKQAKPYSLKLFYLSIAVTDGTNTLGTAKVKLEPTTTNQSLVNNLNSQIGTYVRFELVDSNLASCSEIKDNGAHSIVKNLLDIYAPYDNNGKRSNLENKPDTILGIPLTVSVPSFKVSMQDYIDTLMQYKAKKYTGCLMADLVAPVSVDMDGENATTDWSVYHPNQEERRALHYNLKQIACERKDSVVILSTPYYPSKDNLTALTIDDACDWVASKGSYVDLWEYGSTNTVDYAIQSFYLEIYYSWLMQQCTKIESGVAKTVKVLTAPACLVINNILTSWRERGVQYPVAGDQYGTLPETCTILMNPKTKLERDQLVQYRINPIYDTGTRGIQIYGNETLNAGYTDLNAAHIARLLVSIRSRIDEYTETLKFLINSQILWDQWKSYVSTYILDPLISTNAIAEYSVKMGEDTTSQAEIANRTINGVINLRFYQSAEIFDLSFVIYSTATTLEAEGVL
jgi:hypothetical protein